MLFSDSSCKCNVGFAQIYFQQAIDLSTQNLKGDIEQNNKDKGKSCLAVHV